MLGVQAKDKETYNYRPVDQEFSLLSLSIKRAAKYSPWRAKCFEQAIAGKLMLKWRNKPSKINFGVKKDTENDTLLAHAWLMYQDQVITGWSNFDEFEIIASIKSETNS